MSEKDRIFFGPLDIAEKERLEQEQTGPPVEEDEEEEAETLPFTEKTIEAQQRQQKLIEQLEKKKLASSIAVPTNDDLVKAKLRELNEPIILFGETKPERRKRLRYILAEKGIKEGIPKEVIESAQREKREYVHDEPFLTEGPSALKEARLWVLKDSLKNAEERIKKAKIKLEQPDSITQSESASATKLYETLSKYDNYSSQIGDEKRPVSSCSISPNGQLLATSSWSGLCKIWQLRNCECISTLKHHKARVQHVKFHPHATISQSPNSLNLASCGADNTIKLWSLASQTPIANLTGHEDRVNKLAFHPSGRYLGSTSFDLTWSLWDLETKKDLVVQEGHSRPPYGIAFHCDGALVATSGLDAIARVWDLRSGKTIWIMRGHVKQVLAVDFSPNGYHIATGSDDHTVRVWDLRKKSSVYIIPAHSSLISSVMYQPLYGNYLMTAGFDNTCKIWNCKDFGPVRVLAGHEGKVTHVDISTESDPFTPPKYLVSTSFDRTWKLWTLESRQQDTGEMQEMQEMQEVKLENGDAEVKVKIEPVESSGDVGSSMEISENPDVGAGVAL